jgi:hypothetical protein
MLEHQHLVIRTDEAVDSVDSIFQRGVHNVVGRSQNTAKYPPDGGCLLRATRCMLKSLGDHKGPRISRFSAIGKSQ